MIRFIRGLIVIMLFAFFGAGSLILSFILIPVGGIFIKGRKKREYFSHFIHKLWAWYTGVLISVGLIKIEKNNVEQMKGKIIVATHPSFIDIVILIGIYDNSLCLVKKEILNNFFMKNIVKNVYIPNNVELDEFKDICKAALDDCYNIVIFPTGTRTVKGEDLKIHKGAAALQIDTGADIIPVKIECDYPFLQKNRPVYDAGDSVITYTITQLEPIKLSQFSEKSEIKLRKEISEKIKSDFMS